MSVCLLIIDAQNDFCDQTKGNLKVVGADKDSERLADLIKSRYKDIGEIHATFDSHHKIHIAHPIFWLDEHNNHVAPFTTIDSASIKAKKYRTTNPMFQTRAQDYVEALEQNARYALTIWTEHCKIGTWGQSLYPIVADALDVWESRFACVNKVTKGSNFFTEHYSAVRADVIDPKDPTTKLNRDLIDNIRTYDEIWVAGQALSHCVANTMIDIMNELSAEEIKKIRILEDCCSNVSGFEHLGQQFLATATSKGVKVVTSTMV